MKLKDIGDMANLVAAIGVIISLLVVAYQVNQNTAEARAANRQSVADAARELALSQATTPSLAAAFKAVQAGEQNPTQQWQYTSWLFAWLKTVEDAYLQHMDGRLDEETVTMRVTSADFFLKPEFARNLYQSLARSGELHPDFVTWVDKSLANRQGALTEVTQ